MVKNQEQEMRSIQDNMNNAEKLKVCLFKSLKEVSFNCTKLDSVATRVSSRLV